MIKWLNGLVGVLLIALASSFVFNQPKKLTPEIVRDQHTKVQINRSEIQPKLASLQIPFIENKGQIDPQVAFYAQTFAGPVFVTKNGEMVYAVQSEGESLKAKSQKSEVVVLKESLIGAKVKAIKGEERSITKVNYVKGNDPSKWQKDVSTYQMVDLGPIYQGICLKLRAYGKNVEKLFFVSPGADPRRIQIKLGGSEGLKVNKNGELIVETRTGTMSFTKPVAYQIIDGTRRTVEASYKVEKIQNCQTYSFRIGTYDKNHSLVIDPLIASSVFGGSDFDAASAIALDSNGNVYISGWTRSTNYPTPNNPNNYQFAGETDVFVSKLNSDLTELLVSTYFGGSSSDVAYDLALDASNNVFITGESRSSNFPIVGGVDVTTDSYGDVFIAKLDQALSLQSSTFLGSNQTIDTGYAIDTDSNGDVYITGTTGINFPITNSAYDTSPNGVSDLFISKLNNNLSQLVFSTLLGGDGYDYVHDLIMDRDGNVLITGETQSSDFPTTAGAYDQSFEGFQGSDTGVFVAKLNGDLSQLSASTFLNDDGVGRALAIDADENVFVAGRAGITHPTTEGVYQPLLSADFSTDTAGDAYVSKFDRNLSKLLASTFIGGSNYDFAHTLAIDSKGNIYVGGDTLSFNYPGSLEGDSISNGYGFISEFKNDLTKLLSSTVIGAASGGGGAGWINYGRTNGILGIAMSGRGNIYAVGSTLSPTYPASVGPLDPTISGTVNVFVTELTQGKAPSDFVATAISSTKIALIWKDHSADERGFKLERRTGSCSSTNAPPWVQIKRIRRNSYIYKDTGLTPHQRYSYRVRAYNSSDNSDYSNCSEAQTGLNGTPNAPSLLKARSINNSTIRLTWKDNSSNEQGFRIRSRKIEGNTSTSLPPVTIQTPETERYDLTATNNQTSVTYVYTVEAYNTSGSSPRTREAVVPHTPSLEVALVFSQISDTPTPKQMLVQWTADRYSTAYILKKFQGGCEGIDISHPQGTEKINKNVISRMQETNISNETWGFIVQGNAQSVGWPSAKGYSWVLPENCREDTTPEDPN